MDILDAISPVDGRYRGKTEPLAGYFSESALIRYRVKVEIEYYIALLKELKAADGNIPEDALRDIYRNWSLDSARRVKDIEKTTNHDVKAVEYFIKERLDAMHSTLPHELVHFGLTSQDINNTSFPMMIKEAHMEVVRPMYVELTDKLQSLATDWRNIPMLAHTHVCWRIHMASRHPQQRWEKKSWCSSIAFANSSRPSMPPPLPANLVELQAISTPIVLPIPTATGVSLATSF